MMPLASSFADTHCPESESMMADASRKSSTSRFAFSMATSSSVQSKWIVYRGPRPFVLLGSLTRSPPYYADVCRGFGSRRLAITATPSANPMKYCFFSSGRLATACSMARTIRRSLSDMSFTSLSSCVASLFSLVENIVTRAANFVKSFLKIKY